MIDNVFYCCLYIPDDGNMNYYSMLYNSLLTMEEFYDNSYDIVIFYNSPFDLKKYNHYDNDGNRYNLFERFPYAKFIETDYRKNGAKVGLDGMQLPFATFLKWYCLNHICNLGYNNVFYADCDVVYRDNLNILFQKYKPLYDEVYCLLEGERQHTKSVLGEPGFNGGQYLLSCKTIKDKPSFYFNCIENYTKLMHKAKKVLDEETFKWFMNIADQYAGQVSFRDYKINLLSFDQSDICYGLGLYEEIVKDNKLYINNIKPKILHYFGVNGFKFVPQELMTPQMKEQYKNYIKERLILNEVVG